MRVAFLVGVLLSQHTFIHGETQQQQNQQLQQQSQPSSDQLIQSEDFFNKPFAFNVENLILLIQYKLANASTKQDEEDIQLLINLVKHLMNQKQLAEDDQEANIKSLDMADRIFQN